MGNAAFNQACLVEKAGCDVILPYIENKGFKVIPFYNKTLQEHGDYIIQNGGEPKTIEIKTEKKTTGNFFFETWSNRKWHTLGWIYKIETDFLLYYFQDTSKLYTMFVKDLKDCLFVDQIIWSYPEVRQDKYDQRNDTWGRIVPTEAILNHKSNIDRKWCSVNTLLPF